MRQLSWLSILLGLMVPFSASSAEENEAGWNEEFHNPGDNLVQPTLEDAQVCLSYMIQKVKSSSDYAPVLDEFCALRGLYLNETGED
jgi:hypothetical protein